jgi:hypothetical protein
MLLTPSHFRRGVVLGVVCALLASGPAAAQATDLRSPDVRDQAPTVLPAPHPVRDVDPTTVMSQDLRSPDARDAATRSPAPVTVVPVRVSDPSPATGGDGTDWTLIVLAVAGYLLAVGVVARTAVRGRHRVAV